MLKTKELKQIFIVLVSIVLTLGFSISLQSVLADWAPPTAEAPGNNLLPPIYNEGTIDIPVVNKPLTINDNFYIGTNDLVVDHTTGNVGIGTDSPNYKFTIRTNEYNYYQRDHVNNGDISFLVGSPPIPQCECDSLPFFEECNNFETTHVEDYSCFDVYHNPTCPPFSICAKKYVAVKHIDSFSIDENNKMRVKDICDENGDHCRDISNLVITADDLAANSCGNSELIDDPTFSSITLGSSGRVGLYTQHTGCAGAGSFTLSSVCHTVQCIGTWSYNCAGECKGDFTAFTNPTYDTCANNLVGYLVAP